MVVFFEIDVDEFIALMERETQARRRVLEIIERRRRMQRAASSSCARIWKRDTKH
jgi:hypothetical protein